MPTIVQINSFDSGSTGNIAKQINQEAEKQGYTTYFLFGRFWKKRHKLLPNEIEVGDRLSCGVHLLLGRLFDRVGLGSYFATKRIIKILKKLNPDIIHLHNIHGYYLNYPLFFAYLKKANIPVVWTLHDCWALTGHCSHFDLCGCNRWQSTCYNCAQKREYPKSILLDNSKSNFLQKKKHFTSLGDRLTLVPVSYWLEGIVKLSFFKDSNIHTIHNGVDLSAFKPNAINNHLNKNSFTILGCAAPWSDRKGFSDFIKLREKLPGKYKIVMVGLSDEQIAILPEGIKGLKRTQNIQELVELYSSADVFVNATYEDNFPTVNIEALACGTPVVTYKTGGSPEAIDENTGVVVPRGDVVRLSQAVIQMCLKAKNIEIRDNCRKRAENFYDKKNCFEEYITMYKSIVYTNSGG